MKRIHRLPSGPCLAKFSWCAMDICTYCWYNYPKNVWKCLLLDIGEVNI